MEALQKALQEGAIDEPELPKSDKSLVHGLRNINIVSPYLGAVGGEPLMAVDGGQEI